jgi:predicted flap endonuclease-1-like 5' DNA nuclease
MPVDTAAMIYYALPGLLLGLAIGWFAFRGTAKLEMLQAEREQVGIQVETARAEIAKLERDLASARDQVKPLADEVDKLRKEKAARKAEAAEVPVDAAPTSAGVGWKPGRKLPTFLDAPIGPTDDLSLLKGVGPRLAARLREIGIFYYAQIADWSPEEVKLVDAKLDTFRGRIEKDQLIEQAKLLASGRITEYEARYGRLGSN